MLSFFLLLVFLPLCLGCQTSSFTECQKVPFVPGHNLVGEGFDVVKLQTSGALVVNVKDYMVGGVQGNCTVCHNRLLNQVPPLPKLFQQFQSCCCCSAHSQRNAVLLPQMQKLPVSVLDWRIKVSTFTRFIYADSSCELLRLTS